MLKHICIAAVLLVAGVAHAAKVPVRVVTPNQNVDGSALTNLASIKIEWGTCSGTAPNYAFGTIQSSILILTSAVGVEVKGFVYPSGLQRACLRAYALNAEGVSSDPTGVAVADTLLPKTGKPVTLDKPVILN